MLDFKLTTEAARELGVPPNSLLCLVYQGRMAAPPRDSSGRYLWRPSDLEGARKALQTDRRKRSRCQAPAQSAPQTSGQAVARG